MKVSQEEYDQVLSTIERLSCFRYSTGTTESGAFLTPVDANGIAMDIPKYFTWINLETFARLLLEQEARKKQREGGGGEEQE